eukprot:ANDGO_03802.mRNA.1 hypothetical protein
MPSIEIVKRVNCQLPREAFEVKAFDGTILASGIRAGTVPYSRDVVAAIKKHYCESTSAPRSIDACASPRAVGTAGLDHAGTSTDITDVPSSRSLI